MSVSYCVSIETAGDFLGLALTRFNRKTGEVFHLKRYVSSGKGTQSDRLIPTLDRLLKERRLSKKQIGLVAVDVGPGSFTGVRVGVSTARALGQGLGVPVVGLSSLEAIAHVARVKETMTVVSCLPALAGECYFAVYEARPGRAAKTISLKETLKPCWKNESEFVQMLSALVLNPKKKNRAVVVVGNNAAGLKEAASSVHGLTWQSVRQPARPTAVAEIGVKKFLAQPRPRQFHYEKIRPLYLQPCWAERERAGRAEGRGHAR
jgi:tRNA threonylcarbamoyl adenosine modification protein YeaZ